MDVPMISDEIQMKIQMQNPTQEPLGSLKAPNQDLMDMYILCTFKIEIKSQYLVHGLPKTSEYIQIKI